MFPITINIAQGAIQINQNTEILTQIQENIANISQRLDDLVLRDQASVDTLAAELQTDVNAQNAATAASTQK